MLLSILSTILLILAFPNFSLNFLAFIGFVPLFFALQDKSAKKAFFISYVCGFLFYMGVLYWLYHVTIPGLVILCLYLALYFGILGFLFNRISFSLFLIPLAWIALEYIQSRLFSGFGWALLGYSQYKKLQLIQIADFSGVYGVSFVIMMVNVAIYKFLRRSSRQLVMAALVIALVFWYGRMRVNEGEGEDSIKVSVIQGDIPQEMKWDPEAKDSILDKYINLTRQVAFENPDLIIWPETSFPGYFVSDEKMTEQVLELAKKIGIPILLGANTEEGLRSFNSAVLVSKNGEIIDKYDKLHLVPFGEYVPFSDKLPILHRLVLGELGEFTAGKEYRIFSHKYKFAVLICFEDIFPKMSKKFVQEGAQFLVVVTNDAWYGRSGAPYQHAACSVFRAIENRVPVVRCANTGYSCFIDSRGRIYDEIKENNAHLFVSGYKVSDVKL